jgi:hypothetical protein
MKKSKNRHPCTCKAKRKPLIIGEKIKRVCVEDMDPIEGAWRAYKDRQLKKDGVIT